MDEQIRKAMVELIMSSHEAVVCSIDENGFPNAKSMFLRENEEIYKFWFSSNLSAIHTQQWLKNSKACVYFANRQDIIGLMLTGDMRVYTDDKTKQLHWQQRDEKYYALGPTDPDYCMLCFTATRGNYMAQNKYVFDMSDDNDTSIYKYDNKWNIEPNTR